MNIKDAIEQLQTLGYDAKIIAQQLHTVWAFTKDDQLAYIINEVRGDAYWTFKPNREPFPFHLPDYFLDAKNGH